MNPHSTYANLSDEERAGLDARGSHRVVTDFSVTGESREFCLCECPNSGPQREAQAVAAERRRLAGLLETAWNLIANAGAGNWAYETKEWREAARRWRDDYHDELPRLLEDTSTPSKAEPSGGME